MSKIKAIGNGVIQVGDTLINLAHYREVKKYTFGYDEDPDGKSAYGIVVTPIVSDEKSIKNGVDGSYFITSYLESELKEFETDFDTITAVLKG
jgi:hypothetical protein